MPRYQLDSIRCHAFGQYPITIRCQDGHIITTTALVVHHPQSRIDTVNFSTDAIGTTIMQDYLDCKALVAAITAFHRAQKL